MFNEMGKEKWHECRATIQKEWGLGMFSVDLRTRSSVSGRLQAGYGAWHVWSAGCLLLSSAIPSFPNRFFPFPLFLLSLLSFLFFSIPCHGLFQWMCCSSRDIPLHLMEQGRFAVVVSFT